MNTIIKTVSAFFAKKWVKDIAILVAAGLILLVIEWAWPKLNLFGAFGKAFITIHQWKIPGSIFLIALAVIIVLMIIILKKRPQTTPSISVPTTKLPKEEDLDLGEEHKLLLVTLGVAKDSMTDGALFKWYVDHFPKNHRLEFKLVIDDLTRAYLINVTPNYSGETFYTLLPKGLSVIRRLVNKRRESCPTDESEKKEAINK